mgnify:CR=1 FL=1|jgi:H/ACA ribonucleoprotein complex subunit 1
MVKDFRGGDRGRGGRGGGRGFGGGRGGGGGFGGGGNRPFRGPSGIMVELGEFVHVTEKELLFRAVTSKVPKFNTTVFDSGEESRHEFGTINEILGPYSKYVSHGGNTSCFQSFQGKE